jgi:hypothetical protein
VCSGAVRFPATQQAVGPQKHPVYVGSSIDGSAHLIETALKAHKLRFRVTQIGFIQIYDQLGSDAKPSRIGL